MTHDDSLGTSVTNQEQKYKIHQCSVFRTSFCHVYNFREVNQITDDGVCDDRSFSAD